jgi:hypothetical protein
MDASLRTARGAVHKYLAALQDDRQDILSFTRLYVQASEACSAAGLTLGQLRMQLTGGRAK